MSLCKRWNDMVGCVVRFKAGAVVKYYLVLHGSSGPFHFFTYIRIDGSLSKDQTKNSCVFPAVPIVYKSKGAVSVGLVLGLKLRPEW